uniref:Cytoplasmic tRNA 2-thiolation protein 2 n=1 Tax=Trypanosoma congolense (strain IL3000) TaxID=1068625 RepID=G0V040_TRYCI|nr:conserved hypothetical protein [Trypanosoma congolense IL3000]
MTACFKCQSAPAVVCGRDGPQKSYCSCCFTDFCTRLTRDSLFRNCGMPCDEPIVVAVSGGYTSMMLLHQLGVLRAQNNIRRGEGRVAFELIPMHLCEAELIVPGKPSAVGTVADGDDQESGELRRIASMMAEQFENLKSLIRTRCVQWEFASEPLFTANEVQVVQYSDYLSPFEMSAVREVLHHPRLPLSQRELLHTRLRGRVLALAAADCINAWRRVRQSASGWHHVLTGENALNCCVAALREVLSGSEGKRIAHLAGYRGWVGQCLVMRPLRALIPREAVIYCRLNGIEASFTPSLSTLTALRSLDRTLEVFFNNMLCTYRTSVFNVLNTVTKLDVEDDGDLLEVDLHAGEEGEQKHQERKPKQTKRVITGKAAQHHRERLKKRRPPHHSCAVDASAETDARVRPLCIACGCPTAGSSENQMTFPSGRLRFACAACFQLISDICEKQRKGADTSDGMAPPGEGGVTSGVLSAFESLAGRMQELVGEEGKTPAVERQYVRRRVDARDVDFRTLQQGE